MREAIFMLASGEKGVGKTYKTLEELQAYKKKILVLDVNGEYGSVGKTHNEKFKHIKAIDPSQLHVWTLNGITEARRILPINSKGQPLSPHELQSLLSYIMEVFSNGCLVLEDLTKFVSDSIGMDLIGTLATQRHKSMDVIVHFQSIQKLVQPKIWALSNIIRLHRTEDKVERYAPKMANPTGLYLCENLITILNEQNGNKRACVWYIKESKKIKGDFNKATFEKAIIKFLQDNDKIFKKELNREDLLTGKKVHGTGIQGRKNCYTYMINDYMDTYYGNPN